MPIVATGEGALLVKEDEVLTVEEAEAEEMAQVETWIIGTMAVTEAAVQEEAGKATRRIARA